MGTWIGVIIGSVL